MNLTLVFSIFFIQFWIVWRWAGWILWSAGVYKSQADGSGNLIRDALSFRDSITRKSIWLYTILSGTVSRENLYNCISFLGTASRDNLYDCIPFFQGQYHEKIYMIVYFSFRDSITRKYVWLYTIFPRPSFKKNI